MAKPSAELKFHIKRLNRRSYKSYKELEGVYKFSNYDLLIDHVQSDPYASPSRMIIRIPRDVAGFSNDMISNKSRTIAFCDFLTRKFSDFAKQISKGKRGIGLSGLISIEKPGQEILMRNSVLINDEFLEVRFIMGLPSNNRTISSPDTIAMFFDELPKIISSSLFARNLNEKEIYLHIETSQDADFLRSELDNLNLVAFVSDGAVLPRMSGIDDKPLDIGSCVPFKSPESFKITIMLPNRGPITGMGIRKGVTLIVGGGFHGKSTLLNAIERGVYNHIPGDGREFVITSYDAVKIRASDGRAITGTDISPFINKLPLNKNTKEFYTQNASGSTSQSASIIESMEMGANLLLLDEDTCATNFMIRDFHMQKLVEKIGEPITPFIDKVRQLFTEKAISTIMVMGGSGDYFSKADYVIQLLNYIPEDVTEKAKQISIDFPSQRVNEGGVSFGALKYRIIDIRSINPFREHKRFKVMPRGKNEIIFGSGLIDIGDIEQLVSVSQTRSIGFAINYAKKYLDGKRKFREVLNLVMNDINEKGIDEIGPYITGDLAEFRRFELAFAINRMRTLTLVSKLKK